MNLFGIYEILKNQFSSYDFSLEIGYFANYVIAQRSVWKFFQISLWGAAGGATGAFWTRIRAGALFLGSGGDFLQSGQVPTKIVDKKLIKNFSLLILWNLVGGQLYLSCGVKIFDKSQLFRPQSQILVWAYALWPGFLENLAANFAANFPE